MGSGERVRGRGCVWHRIFANCFSRRFIHSFACAFFHKKCAYGLLPVSVRRAVATHAAALWFLAGGADMVLTWF